MTQTKRASGWGSALPLLAAACLGIACATTSADEPEVLGTVGAAVSEARFGVVVPGPEGQTLVGTRVVPLLPGTTFGWGLRIADAPEDIEFREVYTLPAPPQEVVGEVKQKDPTVVEREARGTDEAGWVVGYWTLDPGDPPGRHVIDVYVEDARVYTFEFDVLVPRAPDPTPDTAPQP